MTRYTSNTPIQKGCYFHVTIDGRVLKHVMEADTVEGWAVYLRLDEAGRLMMEGSKPIKARVHGNVIVTKVLFD